MENTGQVLCEAETSDDAFEALTEYLTEFYGKGNFKIIYIKEAEVRDENLTELIDVTNPPDKRVLH